MRYRGLCLIISLLLFMPHAALSQGNATQGTMSQRPLGQNATSKGDQPSLGFPVQVVHNDTDHLGIQLAYNLKDTLNRSSLFELTQGQGKEIKIILKTQEEFAKRPHLSSIYTIIWVFSYGEDVLGNYLDSETGFVDPQDMGSLAKVLAGKSQEVANEYAYLFED